MEIGRGRRLASSGRADHEFATQQVRLDLILQGIDRHVHRGGERLDARRSAPEDANQGLEVAAVLLVETLCVDLLHVERIARDREADVAVGAGQGVVADPAQAGVGDPRSAAAARGQLPGRFRHERGTELGGVDRDDLGQVVGVVELEVLVHAEPLAKRARKACRCAWSRR